ncbi:MAG: hypothetical protein ACI4TK_10895 [Agathobacter sp.]
MLIIKYKESFIGQAQWVWEIITDIQNPNLENRKMGKERIPKIINRKEALEIIEEECLELVVDNQYGKVYDTPNRDYYEKWKHTIIY